MSNADVLKYFNACRVMNLTLFYLTPLRTKIDVFWNNQLTCGKKWNGDLRKASQYVMLVITVRAGLYERLQDCNPTIVFEFVMSDMGLHLLFSPRVLSQSYGLIACTHKFLLIARRQSITIYPTLNHLNHGCSSTESSSQSHHPRW